MKSVGGITRGRSTTESVKAQWILGAAVNSAVCGQFERFCGEQLYVSVEQHVD